MLKRIWLEHQKFILISGGVLLAFLICDSLISGLSESAEKTYHRCRKMQKQIDSLHKELKRTYWEELARVGALEEQEAALSKQVCMPAERDLKDSRSLLIGLNKRIGDIWEKAQSEAGARGLQLPKKLNSSDFGVEKEDGATQYRVYHSYLDVVERTMGALVGAGMTEIDKLKLDRSETSSVVHEEDLVGVCLYRSVSVNVQGPYDAYVKLFQLCQKPDTFLQARIDNNLAIPKRGDETSLRATLRFSSFRVAEVSEDEEGEEGSTFGAATERGRGGG
ncbi:MAG: hypothetical protein AAF517_08420, partial [Planctomycetota bacterium]